jgi:hypothetical protein
MAFEEITPRVVGQGPLGGGCRTYSLGYPLESRL